MTPESIKREALNKAWHNKWKKQKKTNFNLNETTIKPNCLSVEYAISFFISHSKFAINPAISIVIIDKTNKTEKHKVMDKLNRINKKTPAVTRVEECTNDETGVGAAIAAGNHDEKGTCALLVIKVTNIVKGKI